jgi:hypothetical protein
MRVIRSVVLLMLVALSILGPAVSAFRVAPARCLRRVQSSAHRSSVIAGDPRDKPKPKKNADEPKKPKGNKSWAPLILADRLPALHEVFAGRMRPGAGCSRSRDDATLRSPALARRHACRRSQERAGGAAAQEEGATTGLPQEEVAFRGSSISAAPIT